MNEKLPEQTIITRQSAKKFLDSAFLVGASLDACEPYNGEHEYSPKEREPFDALTDRFVRAVEVALKFMRSYERYLYAENSDTIRDLLNRMAKTGIISSSELWLRMREIRNRIVHDYLPQDIQEIYRQIMGEMGKELMNSAEKIRVLSFDD
jgi:uncharacterized protein YutE (UPF0331/DUF86 family)